MSINPILPCCHMEWWGPLLDYFWQKMIWPISWRTHVIITPANEVGLCWFHFVHSFVCMSIHLPIRVKTKSCLLCIFHKTSGIHFIFTHWINQHQMVRCVICQVILKILKLLSLQIFLFHDLAHHFLASSGWDIMRIFFLSYLISGMEIMPREKVCCWLH